MNQRVGFAFRIPVRWPPLQHHAVSNRGWGRAALSREAQEMLQRVNAVARHVKLRARYQSVSNSGLGSALTPTTDGEPVHRR